MKHMTKATVVLLFATALLSGFRATAGNKVYVAVAANMQFAIQELKSEFEKETGITAEITIGSSGNLCAQIMESAPLDVFVSADMNYPETLYKKGWATTAPKTYAYGSLVLWTTRPGITPDAKLAVLSLAPVKKIAIANPQTAPYGVAAQEALRYYHAYDKVKDKLVYGESIAQTQQFISSGAADIGFIAKAIVLSAAMKGKGAWVDIAPKAYSPIAQGAVLLRHGKETNDNAAEKFYRFLYSAKARAIFKKYGYLVGA